MTTQPGILEGLLDARDYLEYRLRTGVTRERLRAALAATGSVPSGLHRVVAFGPKALELLGLDVPLEPFTEIRGAGQIAPATQRDVWIAISGGDHADVFDAVVATHRALAPVAELELDLRGFDYHGSRDLIGFEDGTANPKDEKAVEAAVVAEGPGTGGSIVLTQQWVHDLAAFEALPVALQEKIVGRTKVENVELEGDDMPPDSHVSRTDVKIDGTAMKVLRRSSPYGNATEHGLYFVAFACERRRIQVQLDRMYGVGGDDIHDRLIEFSRAVTGSYWFAPSREELERLTSGA